MKQIIYATSVDDHEIQIVGRGGWLHKISFLEAERNNALILYTLLYSLVSSVSARRGVARYLVQVIKNNPEFTFNMSANELLDKLYSI